jgi:sugar phosphate isomerase/epimerase
VTMKIGVQLYTLREECERDFIGVLEAVSKMGYEGVELAGFHGISAFDLKETLNRLGLIPISSHVPLERLESEPERVLKEHLELGVEYLVCPWVPEERRRSAEDWLRLAKTLNRFGERSVKEGIRLLYHHHEFEFVPVGGSGETAMDLLLRHTDPNVVGIQPDVYWAAFAGVSPDGWIRRLAGRCPLIHAKDMDKEDRSFAEVGQGELPWREIVDEAKVAGARWLVVEQDICRRPPLESVRISLEYLRKNGLV